MKHFRRIFMLHDACPPVAPHFNAKAGYVMPRWKIENETIFINDRAVGALPAVDIAFYEQEAPPGKLLRDLPEGVEIKRVDFSKKESAAQSPDQITESQFAALYNAIAKASDWWPITKDKGWDWQSLFYNTDVYVMYRDNKPVGFYALDHQLKDDPTGVKLLYIGVIPSQHGQKLGGHLIDHAMAKGWSREDMQDGLKTTHLLLDTVPQHDVMLAYGKPCATLYESRGFQLNRTERCTPGDPGTTMNQFNFPAYWKDIDVRDLENHLNEKFHAHPATPEATAAVTVTVKREMASPAA